MMARALLMILLALALVAPAEGAAPHKPTAAGEPAFTKLDACALEGRGFAIAGGNVCLKVTGGVYFQQSWGNSTGGNGAASGGQPIVVTPDDTYTIPAPR